MACMIVMKFGGTSVGSAAAIQNVAEIVETRISQEPVVVVSALSGVTDLLILAANDALNGEFDIKRIRDRHLEVIHALTLKESLIEAELKELEELLARIAIYKEVTTKTMDSVLSFGERMSAKIVASYFRTAGIRAEAHNAYELGLVTNDAFGEAEPLPESEEQLRERLKDKRAVPVITGFIAMTKAKEITTLGRGGSDYSAAIIGAAVSAQEIQIWTDVDGVMTSDPKIVKQARTVPKMSFQEASELAFFGAKVLHPKTIIPAMIKSIPVRVLNTHNIDHPGTMIVPKLDKAQSKATGIACKKDIVVINITSTRMLNTHGFMAKVFEVFKKHAASVDMVATSEVSISVTLNNHAKLDRIIEELGRFSCVECHKDRATINVVGEGIRTTPGITSGVFSALSKHGIRPEIISLCASRINIGFVIMEDQVNEAISVLHDELF